MQHKKLQDGNSQLFEKCYARAKILEIFGVKKKIVI